MYNTLKGKLNPIPDRISGPAQELVLSMLQTDPSKRPSLEQIATHSCVTSMQPLDAAFQFEVRKLVSEYVSEIKDILPLSWQYFVPMSIGIIMNLDGTFWHLWQARVSCRRQELP